MFRANPGDPLSAPAPDGLEPVDSGAQRSELRRAVLLVRCELLLQRLELRELNLLRLVRLVRLVRLLAAQLEVGAGGLADLLEQRGRGRDQEQLHEHGQPVAVGASGLGSATAS